MMVCRRGCDHPQPMQTRRGLVCMDCWVHRHVISLLVPYVEAAP